MRDGKGGGIRVDREIKLEPIEKSPGYILMRAEERIQQKYDQLGGAAFFGEVVNKAPGSVWTFASGAISYNTTAEEAFAVYGAIYVKWQELGGLKWGNPSTDENPTPDGVGRVNHFNDGTASIYWTPDTGAHGIWGNIRGKWMSLGAEQSILGYPVTDELPTPDGVGRFNHFSNAGSIYWTPDTGPNAIHGAIRQRWADLGWERSYLGYPTGDEVDFAQGGRASEFQNGGIYWWADTGAIDLRDVIVRYVGLHCFGTTDWPGDDDPYVVIGAATPQISNTIRTGTQEDVGEKETRLDLIDVYRGRPYGMKMLAVFFDHDHGDPDSHLQRVREAVLEAHNAGVEALKLIPYVGPEIAKKAGPVLEKYVVPEIVDFLTSWIGDDEIGGSNFELAPRDMVLFAARTPRRSFKDIEFHFESPLISGEGASYKAYFDVVPA